MILLLLHRRTKKKAARERPYVETAARMRAAAGERRFCGFLDQQMSTNDRSPDAHVQQHRVIRPVSAWRRVVAVELMNCPRV